MPSPSVKSPTPSLMTAATGTTPKTGGDHKKMGHHQLQQISIDEEIDCMKNIEESLTSSLKTITNFADMLYQERDLLREDFEEEIEDYEEILKLSRMKFSEKFNSFILPCVDEVLECFQLIVTLLGSDPDPLRIQMVVFENTPEFVATLLAFVAIPIPFRTNPDFNVSILNQKTEAIFLNLKVYALKTLTKFISICSYEAANMYEDEEEASRNIAKECAECIVEGQGLEVLLNFLEIDENESVRVAIAEALFFFIVRNEMGRLAVVIQRGVSTFANCLEIETSAVIRSYYCAILRELGSVYPEELLKEDMIHTASKLLNLDPSPEVRALSAEILDVLMRGDPRAIRYLDESQIDLATILSDKLMQDQNREVLEAICKLLETLFSLKARNFTNKFIQIGGWRSFIRCLKSCSTRPASLAMRALRCLIQNADYSLMLGKTIVSHFPTLSVLLKASMEQDDKAAHKRNAIIAHKLLKVELATCLGLIFAQNPTCRRHVHNQLKAFPVWMSALRSSLLKNLSLAEMDYYSNVSIVDFSGVSLVSSLQTDQPDGPAIKTLFVEQDGRWETLQAQATPDIDTLYGTRDMYRSDMTESSVGKLVSYLLSFAIHLTLSPSAENDSSERTDGQSSPFMSSPSFSGGGGGGAGSSSGSVHRNQTESSFGMGYDERSTMSAGNNNSRSPTPLSLYNEQKRESPFKYISNNLTDTDVRPNGAKSENEDGSGAGRPSFMGDEVLSTGSQRRTHQPLFHNFIPRDDLWVDTDSDAHSVISREGSEFNLQPRKNRYISQFQEEFVVNSPQHPPHDITESVSEHVLLRRKKLSNRALTPVDGALLLAKQFAAYYVDERQLKRKEQAEKKFLEHYRIQSSPSTKSPFGKTTIGPAVEGVLMRQFSSPSPQKMKKSWIESDVKEGDLFNFDLSFDGFSSASLDSLMNRAKKHQKNVKKYFVTCPQGTNARGRRTFLLDMDKNIMPKLLDVIAELTKLTKERGEERIKMILYLWNGRDRASSTSSKSLNSGNITAITSFVKEYLLRHDPCPGVVLESDTYFDNEQQEEEAVVSPPTHTEQHPDGDGEQKKQQQQKHNSLMNSQFVNNDADGDDGDDDDDASGGEERDVQVVRLLSSPRQYQNSSSSPLKSMTHHSNSNSIGKNSSETTALESHHRPQQQQPLRRENASPAQQAWFTPSKVIGVSDRPIRKKQASDNIDGTTTAMPDEVKGITDVLIRPSESSFGLTFDEN